MDFNKSIVVLTGASRGFGKALAKAFTELGSIVILTSNEKQELEATANELSVDYFLADASSYEDTIKLAQYVESKYGKIDVWINNAGIQIAPSDIENVDINKLHKLFSINFFGYFYGCKVAVKAMKSRNSGLIININSTAGLIGKPGLSAYVSSKYAIKGMSESVREEIKDTNVKLFQIFPGGMQTDIYHEKVPEDINEYMSVDYAVQLFMKNLASDQPEQDLVIKRPNLN